MTTLFYFIFYIIFIFLYLYIIFYFIMIVAVCFCLLMQPAALTFNLLLRPPGMAGSSRDAHIIPVDVLEKHLSVPAGQGACLQQRDTHT